MPLPRRIKARTRKPIIMKLTNYPVVQRLDLSSPLARHRPTTHPLLLLLPYTSIVCFHPLPIDFLAPYSHPPCSQGSRSPIQFPNSRGGWQLVPTNYHTIIIETYPILAGIFSIRRVLGEGNLEGEEVGGCSGRDNGRRTKA